MPGEKQATSKPNWINWLTYRAGKSRTWWCPSPGEQVVLFSLGGNLENSLCASGHLLQRLPAAFRL
ncbi:baseplate assembly protein V [Klebsiella grimontii]|uniref:Baseplate assembly protein V n=1 Tax=Klebsiella grimontii TaxID=2058152 RepID=A0A7H4NYL8_9ENTR|nr:baseplate assembly protein V [Klebsiella grimontii]